MAKLAGRWALGLLALAAFVGCAYLRGRPGYFAEQHSNTNYQLEGKPGWRTTPGGVRLFDARNEVADARIDAEVDRLEACLAAMPTPTPDQLTAATCHIVPPWKRHVVRRDWFEVVIAPDWYVSRCTGKQLFPCGISKADCDRARADKGLAGNCPCACRATVQSLRSVVTAPNLELFPGTLFALVTGCTTPWMAPFSACTAPSEAR